MNSDNQTPRPDYGPPPAAAGDAGTPAPPARPGPGPGAPAWAPPPPPAWGPPGGGWPPSPDKGGIFRQHPLIMVMLLILLGAAVITIIAAAVGGGMAGHGGFSDMGFGRRVGVVKVEGVIVDSRETIDQIERYLDDDSIAAVVLRVDSPGGVVGAAQEIHDEVKRLAARKPVVVSMGSVAASGGYYIACPARKIFANQGTITGSIGVVMEITNLEGLFQWMKVKNVVIKSGEFKDAGSPYREMTPKERAYLQGIVDNLFLQFENAVAKGRNLDLEKVHKLADGRVYTGLQAKDLGLVDEIGSMFDAIQEAGQEGGIKGKPRVVWPPRRRQGLLGQLMDNLVPPDLRGDKALLPSPVRVMYIIDINP